ncbi:60S ribosomal protein L6 [Hortaea werneckii]|nr:60S ribosomal protein L6 [Hortaea werneckii]
MNEKFPSTYALPPSAPPSLLASPSSRASPPVASAPAPPDPCRLSPCPWSSTSIASASPFGPPSSPPPPPADPQSGLTADPSRRIQEVLLARALEPQHEDSGWKLPSPGIMSRSSSGSVEGAEQVQVTRRRVRLDGGLAWSRGRRSTLAGLEGVSAKMALTPARSNKPAPASQPTPTKAGGAGASNFLTPALAHRRRKRKASPTDTTQAQLVLGHLAATSATTPVLTTRSTRPTGTTLLFYSPPRRTREYNSGISITGPALTEDCTQSPIMSSEQAQTKKFQKGERTIPAPSQQASKYYPAEDDAQPKKVRKTLRPYKPRSSLKPGAVLILLAGRFRGKRVVLLKVLDQGALLVTGPFKINGVPLRRVNARYVIATSTNVPIDSIDKSTVEKVGKPEYFARDRKADKKGSEEGFFAQQEGKGAQKKEVSSARAEDQKKVDEGLVKAIKKESLLHEYLKSQWSLRKGDKPHEMVF